jgi:hypothetical protein
MTVKDLLEIYHTNKYPMDTGSDNWADIKTDYELENDALVGTAMQEDYEKVGKEKVAKFKASLLDFKKRLIDYSPVSTVEEKEKEILQEKIGIGLEIYDLILEKLHY